MRYANIRRRIPKRKSRRFDGGPKRPQLEALSCGAEMQERIHPSGKAKYQLMVTVVGAQL
jgi:hypothetical protein